MSGAMDAEAHGHRKNGLCSLPYVEMGWPIYFCNDDAGTMPAPSTGASEASAAAFT